MDRRKSLWLLLGSALVLAVLMQVPQWIHMSQTASHGFPVELNSDEDLYFSKVEEALSGRPEQSAEGITGDPAIVPLQSAFLEQLTGTLFSWTNLRAITVLQIMDSVIPPLLFIILFWFLRLCGFSFWYAFGGTVLFTILELYNLNRPIHQRDSTLLVLLSLCCILQSFKGRAWLGWVGAVLLGLLVGIYFWSWTYAWTYFGLLFLWEFSAWAYGRWYPEDPQPSMLRRAFLWLRSCIPGLPGRKYTSMVHPWQWLAMEGVLATIVAAPFALTTFSATHHPLYSEVLQRLELMQSHVPESPVRSSLFVLMTLGLLGGLAHDYKAMRRYKNGIIAVVAALIVLNQQIIHGVTFLFSSHYLFVLVIAGIIALGISIDRLRVSRWLMLSMAGSSLFLLGIAYDARYVLSHFRPEPSRFVQQHLADALPTLDALPRITVLSDGESMRFIASHTHHDTVYTDRLNYMIIAEEDLAERFCTTKLPLPPSEWKLNEHEILFYDPDQISLDSTKRAAEEALAQAACERMSREPANALRNFNVRYILWNEKAQPKWNLELLKTPLEKMAGGEGWSLWRLL